jgi:putative transposase
MEGEGYRRAFRRVNETGHVRFLTFSAYRRLPLLDHDAIRGLFVERLRIAIAGKNVQLLAWVIMPEHAHLLVFPEGDPDMGRFGHAFKRPLAEAVLRRWKELDAPILRQLSHGKGYRFWQTGGGYDRNLYTPDAIIEKANYIHANPVRRGLVAAETDWPWSSARFHAGRDDALLPCGPMPF